MFADDVKIVGDPGELRLQNGLHQLSQWTKAWQLPLNVAKCQLLSVIGQRQRELSIATDAGVTSLEAVTEARDLGIRITADFKPTRQCAEAARRGQWALSRLIRTVTSRRPSVLLPLYKAFVRPHLEYAVQAWAPYFKKDCQVIERVQRRFTRLFPETRNQEYELRLTKLNLFSMKRRRLRGDLIETFR
jgi:ribonuclease P/MRP protein subunit RPP40